MLRSAAGADLVGGDAANGPQAGMKAREPGAELGERGTRYTFRREPPVEARRGGELAHLDRVFDCRLAADARRRRRAADRHDGEIQRRGEPPVHAQLFAAKAPA